MVVKYVSSFLVAAILSVLVFIGMQALVGMEAGLGDRDQKTPALNFVRVEANQQDLKTKDRNQPDPPPEPEPQPETPDTRVKDDTPQTTAQISMNMPNINTMVSQGEGMSMAGINVGSNSLSGFSSDAVATMRVPPNYPQKAKRAGLEGYVTMAVNIRANGTVSDVEVIDSNPPRLFDNAAVQAMKRWRFRPKTENGEKTPQKAKQTIEFTLD